MHNFNGRNMNSYQTIIILHKEQDLEKFKYNILQFFKSSVEYAELGIKEFAYEIQGETEGNYIEIKWDGNEKDVYELETRFLKFNNFVLKFITVKIEF